MIRFGIIGCGGYIAPRHLKAIKDIGGELVCAMDKNDSVGILDRYFKGVDFFTEFERFDRYCEVLKQKGEGLDYVAICSPNYLHSYHCLFAMRIGANAICEKPLVTSVHILDQLKEAEQEYGKRIFTILQLRYHPKILELKNGIKDGERYSVKLKYITPRGRWYHHSWKGDRAKSGGLLMNIGVHFIDMLGWIFGDLGILTVMHNDENEFQAIITANNKGTISEIDCHLSIEETEEPKRELTVNGKEIDFTDGFTELHTECYKQIINKEKWYGIDDVRPALSFIDWII